MVRKFALFLGLLCVLATHASLAAENGAPLFALPPLPETDYPGRPTDLIYVLVGFPDGSAALQASVSPADVAKDVEVTPTQRWLIRIDAAGQAGHWTRQPALTFDDAEPALGLNDGGIVFRWGDRGFVYLAKVDRSGMLLWERDFQSGIYGNLPRPIALADGFAVLEEDVGSCLLRRLDENGIERWHVKMPIPIEQTKYLLGSGPIMVAPKADGGFIVLCDWPNYAAERSEGWLSDIDPQGQMRWQRPLRAFAATGLALRDGTLAVLGLLHRIPDDPTNPYQEAPTLMRFDGTDGRMLRADSNVFPSDIEMPWDSDRPGGLVALPDGELLAVAELDSIQSTGPFGLFAARIGRENGLLWLRPLSGKTPEPGWARIGGTAVLANRQVLYAVNSYDKAAEVANATLRVLPLD